MCQEDIIRWGKPLLMGSAVLQGFYCTIATVLFSDGSNILGDEEGSDQGEVMYEDDVLEEIDNDPSPENGL